MNNYDSYLEAEQTIIAGGHEFARSDVSEGLTGQHHWEEMCLVAGIPHTFYMVTTFADNINNNEVVVDTVIMRHTK